MSICFILLDMSCVLLSEMLLDKGLVWHSQTLYLTATLGNSGIKEVGHSASTFLQNKFGKATSPDPPRARYVEPY